MAADPTEWSFEDIVPDCKLPGDLMVSILTYLPVKSLLKFKAVSKPWCSFISSPLFLKIHLQRLSLVEPNNCLMMLEHESGEQDWTCCLLNLTHRYSTPVDGDVLMLEFPSTKFTIIDSCNGLVCVGGYRVGSTDLVLWNPATKRQRSLVVPRGDDLDFRTLGLCYVDAATNDFKIFVWNHSRLPSPVDTPYLYVYSLSSDSWDKLDFYASKIVVRFERPTFMGRCMHWLAHTCPNDMDCRCSSASEIVAVDVMDGAISWFHLPVDCGRHFPEQPTLVIRGCLSLVNFTDAVGDDLYGFEVWVMEEYGVEGSWVKRFFFQEGFALFRPPLASWNYGEIVFNCNYDEKRVLMLFYDPYSKKKSYVEFLSHDVVGFFGYVESLASVGTS